MAKVDEDLDLDLDTGEKKSGGGKMKKIIIFSVIGILIIGISIGLTLMLLGGGESDSPATAEAETEQTTETDNSSETGTEEGGESVAYMDLSPAFVVNLEGTNSEIRYLQVNMSVEVGSDADVEVVRKHSPVIRHHLNLLFSSLDFSEINSTEGKARLTSDALDVVQKALKKATGKKIVKNVYFNSIVGQ
jgi:flagellar FliL protein